MVKSQDGLLDPSEYDNYAAFCAQLVEILNQRQQRKVVLILRYEPYKDLGGDYFDKQRPEATKKHLVKRLEKLGYQVSLEMLPTNA